MNIKGLFITGNKADIKMITDILQFRKNVYKGKQTGIEHEISEMSDEFVCNALLETVIESLRLYRTKDVNRPNEKRSSLLDTLEFIKQLDKIQQHNIFVTDDYINLIDELKERGIV